MRTICLDPVTPPLLTTRRSGSGDVAARHVEHYRSCPCLGGTDMCCVPSCCPPFLSFVTVDRPPPVVHACPPEAEESGLMPCCGRTPFEKPGDRITLEPSQVTCPVGWIGQRVAIYADKRTPAWLEAIWPPNLPADASKALQPYGERVVMDAIVGSGTLAEALPIRQGACNERTDHICRTRDGRLLIHRTSVAQADISDQLPLQDWTPGRWALRFTDVAPIIPRWKRDRTGTKRRVWLDIECPVVAPALSGDGTYREWTP